jgi:hypothetical protein
MKTYTLKAVENLIDQYIEKGGEIIEAVTGSLGYGTVICSAYGCKFAVIEEIFLNAWQSTHTIKMYNQLPKKYNNLLNNLYKLETI